MSNSWPTPRHLEIMDGLYTHVIFANTAFGQKPVIHGFCKDPDTEELSKQSLVAVEMESGDTIVLIDGLEEKGDKEALDAILNTPRFILVEGKYLQTDLKVYGPFATREQALHVATIITESLPIHIVEALHEDSNLVYSTKPYLRPYMAEESRMYHQIMQNLSDLKLEHGTCHPRSRHACTHCNARDDLEKLISEYKGPRIHAS